MALIELNLEKPALKRSETIGDETDATVNGERAEEADPVDTRFEEIELDEDRADDQSRGRIRRTARLVGILAVAIGSAVTLKKLRNRDEMPGDGVDSEI